MESCRRSSSRVRLVLWSQEYFLLMESCRFRRYVSDSRASLKNCQGKKKKAQRKLDKSSEQAEGRQRTPQRLSQQLLKLLWL